MQQLPCVVYVLTVVYIRSGDRIIVCFNIEAHLQYLVDLSPTSPSDVKLLPGIINDNRNHMKENMVETLLRMIRKMGEDKMKNSSINM